MAHSYEELKAKTVAELRAIAEGIEHDALHGYLTMHKQELLPALCEALRIEAHEHHEAVGIDKTAIKQEIRRLKAERDLAMEAHNPEGLKRIRTRIKRLKRKIRRATARRIGEEMEGAGTARAGRR